MNNENLKDVLEAKKQEAEIQEAYDLGKNM